MGFASVYRCLQELFPQLDARILKAVAIENSKDPDVAVEVVLSEILPRMTEITNPPAFPQGSLDTQNHLDEEVQEEDEGSLLRRHRPVASGSKFLVDADGYASSSNASVSKVAVSSDGRASSSMANASAHPAPVINEASFWDANDSNGESHEDMDCEVVTSPRTAEEARATSMDQISPANLVAMHHFNVAKALDESNGAAENEELILLGMIDNPPARIRRTSPSIMSDLSNSVSGEDRTADGDHVLNQDENEDLNLVNALSYLEPVSVQKHALEADTAVDVTAEYLNDIDTAEEAGYVTPTAHELGVEDALNLTRSTQIGEVEILEQIIEDAKNNKKTLFSAMESVINTMKEVEEREIAAEQAREEAAQGSSDVYRRVEELKKMIQSAKEANDMHAGEVYGERAILATEVRELQTRLLNLSDERDRSLTILDEMRIALETRLAAAEEVREAAEREKQANVESTASALKEQEAAMERVVHESKVLQEEAEENSKLREFLMDRGRVVDQLQGEIAVICQDVKLLKERFDSGVALSKSISSGQTSCILASLSSSLNSSATSNQAPENDETWKGPNEARAGSSVDGSSPRGKPEDKNATGAELKELSDEDGGWELFV